MNELTYTMVGDYNLPNLSLPKQPEVTLGRWANMRRTYLKEYRKILYYNLLTKGTLTSHLATIQEEAMNLEEKLVTDMAKSQGLSEQMKVQDMMAWTQMMNNIRSAAMEIVMKEVIYA